MWHTAAWQTDTASSVLSSRLNHVNPLSLPNAANITLSVCLNLNTVLVLISPLKLTADVDTFKQSLTEMATVRSLSLLLITIINAGTNA